MPLKQKYLDWNQALIPQVRDCLLKQIDSTKSPVDLSQLLIIVPTNQSGRYLLEALADNTITQSKGLLSPKILTPVQFLENGILSSNKANEAQCISAWVEVLKASTLSDIETLFPNIDARDESFILSTAQRFLKLKKAIGTEGLNMQNIAQKCQSIGVEAERWQEAAQLELKYLALLKKHKLIDPTQLKLLSAYNYPLDPSISKILLIATPDPQTLVLNALKNLRPHTEIEVWINGPKEGLFDEWGIPETGQWKSRKLPIDQWNLEINTIKQALSLAEFSEETIQASPVESLQIGVLDRTLVNPLNDYFKLKKTNFNNPEGDPLSHTALGRLILSLLKLESDLNIDHLKQVLLNPYFLKYEAPELCLEEVLSQIDDSFSKHLSYELNAFKAMAQRSTKTSPLIKLIERIQLIAQSLTNEDFLENLREYLGKILQKTGILNLDSNYLDLTEVLNRLFYEHIENRRIFHNLPLGSRKRLFLESLHSQQIYRERKEEAHDLLGWLELLWHDAPYSLLCGFNEGIVPSTPNEDALLPESLKRLLNIKTSDTSYAKDLYLFESICRKRSHSKSGKVKVLLCENDLENNPLLPSRILFQVKQKDLLKLTEQILIKKEPEDSFVNLKAPWKFQAVTSPPLSLPKHFSVSALKDYLQCPFRFYLKHILKIKPKNLNEKEMSAATFGTLFHNTVSSLAGQKFDASTHVEMLQDSLCKQADALILEQFGKQLSFALQMQRASLMERIKAFIEAQMRELKEHKSIEILSTEKAFTYSLGNFEIHGIIDRIDSINGAKRLVDYKTSESPIEPSAAHLKSAGTKGEPRHLPSEAYYHDEKKTWYWKDLQLPLYCLSQIENESTEIPELTYFQIPKSEEKTGLKTWSNFSSTHLKSAKSCAESILHCIEIGQFWPPNDSIDPIIDPYADYFPDGISKSVVAESFENVPYAP